MAKYDPLYHYLMKLEEKRITLPFEDVEEIIGKKLPESAYEYQEWWANETSKDTSHIQCLAWRNAGYKASVNIDGKFVTFEKAD